LEWRLKRPEKWEVAQGKYINKVLEKFNMVDAKLVSSPLASHFVLSAKKSPSTKAELEEIKKISYQAQLGAYCLRWCAQGQISLKLWVLCKNICQIQVESIGKLSSRFLGIWRAQETWGLYLKDNIESRERRVSLVSLTLIMKRFEQAKVYYTSNVFTWVEDPYVEDLCSNRSMRYLLWKLNIWFWWKLQECYLVQSLVNKIGLKQDLVEVKCEVIVQYFLWSFRSFMQIQNTLKYAITGFEIGSTLEKLRLRRFTRMRIRLTSSLNQLQGEVQALVGLAKFGDLLVDKYT